MLTLKDIREAAERGGEALIHDADGRLFVGQLEALLNADGTVTVLNRLGAFMGTFEQVDTLFRLFHPQEDLALSK